MSSSKQVWLNLAGRPRPRTDWVSFQRTFDLSAPAGEAELRLFASSRYRLTVNDQILGYGPARFLPKYAEFAVYDLQKYLRAGSNTIVVEACFIDCNSFQHVPDTTGRFIAWGQVHTGRETVDLATPGDWLAQRRTACIDAVPAFSFAIGPVEVRDTRVSDSGWRAVDVITSSTDEWEFSPPSVPPAGGGMIRPALRQCSPIVSDEDRIGFVSIHPTSRSSFVDSTRGQHFRYATYLHSPAAQTVTLAVHWGPHFLNGVQLEPANDPDRGNRQHAVARLQTGWNLLCGEPEQLQPSYPVLIGIPAGAEVTAHALPDLTVREPIAYQPARVLSHDERWTHAAPARAEDASVARETWTFAPPAPPACPARMMAWDLIRPAAAHSPTTAAPDAKTAVVETESAAVDAKTSTLAATTTAAWPLRAPTNAREWTCVFDVGTEYLAHVRIDLEAPAGTIVDVGYGEQLRNDGSLNWFRANPFIEMADRFFTAGGRGVLETFYPRGGRYVQITIRAAATDAPVNLHGVALRDARSSLPLDQPFASSDPLFAWTWKTGVESLRASADDAFCDSPWRERGVYLGDSYVQSMVELVAAAKPALGRRALRLFAAGQRSDGQFPNVVPAWFDLALSEFSLIYVLWLHDYWQETGDLAIVRECIGAVDRLLQSPAWRVSTHSVLWDVPAEGKLFVDWGVHKPARSYDENGVLNAFRYRALQNAAAMFHATGDAARARDAQTQADAVRAAFEARLWLESHNRFAGGTLKGEAIADEIIHVNVLALAFGLCSAGNEPRLVRYVLDRVSHNVERALDKTEADDYIELYFLKYLLDALVRIDRHDVAKAVITQHMQVMRDHGAPTLWEGLRSGFRGRGSRCHSWSAGPLIYLARFANEHKQAPGRPAAAVRTEG